GSRTVATPERARQRPVRAVPLATCESPRARERDAGAGRAGGPCQTSSTSALGRTAATRRTGPGAGATTAAGIAGRAVLQSRPRPARAAGGPSPDRTEGHRRRRVDGHALAGRGLRHGRPDRGDRRRPPAAMDNRLRPLPPP